MQTVKACVATPRKLKNEPTRSAWRDRRGMLVDNGTKETLQLRQGPHSLTRKKNFRTAAVGELMSSG